MQKPLLATAASLFVGLGLGLLAWLLPVSFKSLSPTQLEAAAHGTPGLAELGERFLQSEKPGPAQLVHAAARELDSPEAVAIEATLAALAEKQRAFAAWGAWAPALEPLLDLENEAELAVPAPTPASVPAFALLAPEAARTVLRASLGSSRSTGVAALLGTREVAAAQRFVPALQPGGQALDTVIVLTALLYQAEQFSPELRRELRDLAAQARAQDQLGPLEELYIDLLSLSQRLNWGQLAELLSRSSSRSTLEEFAHLARIAPRELPIMYTAALFTDSADRVARYLIRYGKPGAADLRLAVGLGAGAVEQLVARQVPINHSPGPALSEAAGFSLRHPELALALKYLGYLVAAFLLFRGVERALLPSGASSGAPLRVQSIVQSGVLSVFAAGLIILATEPYLLAAAEPLSEYRVRLPVPLLANMAVPADSSEILSSSSSMTTSTLVSIAIFALLQVGIYFICLRKLEEIRAQALAPLLKLRLVENEDNLFDSGLYVGMMGTATALVLQVLGVIDHNLLAAYASNLFGLVCVALIKIRHVRGFKNGLILEAEAASSSAHKASARAPAAF